MIPVLLGSTYVSRLNKERCFVHEGENWGFFIWLKCKTRLRGESMTRPNSNLVSISLKEIDQIMVVKAKDCNFVSIVCASLWLVRYVPVYTSINAPKIPKNG